MPFKPNRAFRRRYNWIFKRDPGAANLYLLIAELADEKGDVETSEDEMIELMAARFNDYREYQL